MSNLNQFNAPTTTDFAAIIGDEYASLAVEVTANEVILKEQDLQVIPFETPPSVTQLTDIGAALVEMFIQKAEAEAGRTGYSYPPKSYTYEFDKLNKSK